MKIITQAPGRAEIIGNHTDYNHGFALSAAIDKFTTAEVSARSDSYVYAFSDTFYKKPVRFSVKNLKKDKNHWTNYVKALIEELNQKRLIDKGFNLHVTSSVPSSGGVSSSAALELSVGLALTKLYDIKLSKIDLAYLCQKAENGPLVSSPCGFLDQATSALAKKNSLLYLDFLPKKGIPVSKYEYIPIDLDKNDISFLIVVDKKIKRNLGESGYPERRKMCERSLPILSKLLKRKIKSLRDVSVAEFEKYRKNLEKVDRKMRMRVEHVVWENQRVLDAVEALRKKDIKLFGELLTRSGKSALELYELDEKTPELTYLLQKARNMAGVLGARNMGGGFSVNILVLIKNSSIEEFKNKLTLQYAITYHRELDFIIFHPEKGAKMCYSKK